MQTFHIFKKDLRRHWPEILISLAFLALFTRRELHLWKLSSEFTQFGSTSAVLFVFVGRYVPFFLVLSWTFLILRVVHGDTLVGDRQWWITKPYVWRELLLSKLFFIFVFICVPLFHVQLLLLHHAGFPILANLGRLLLMQFTLTLVVIACVFALASVTKNLAQALLGIGIVIVVLIIGLSLDSFFTQTAGDSPIYIDQLETLLFFGSIIVVPIWQFARRASRNARITLAVCIGAAAALSLIPFGSRMEQTYPLLAMKDSVAQFTVPPIAQTSESGSGLPNFTSDLAISVPVNVSVLSPDSVVIVNRMQISLDSAEDSRWTRGWVGEYQQIWPGSQRLNLGYAVKRKEYEKIKSKILSLHIQLALSEYQEVEPRSLILPNGTFKDTNLGICRLEVFVGQQILECMKPFRAPAFVARFDAPDSPCGSVQRSPNSTPTNLDVAHAWHPPNDEFLPDPGLNPVIEYQLAFNPMAQIPSANSSLPGQSSAVTLCSGAEIHLARPVFKRRYRIQLEIPPIRLQDLIVRGFL